MILRKKEWPLEKREQESLPSSILQFYYTEQKGKEKNWGGRSMMSSPQGAQAIRDKARTRSQYS